MTTAHKIIVDEQLLNSVLEAHRAGGRRIVLTNGTFDVLHVGHIRALEGARAAGVLTPPASELRPRRAAMLETLVYPYFRIATRHVTCR